MSPPSGEQLVRDYLNRVSVAARGRLSADDRRALVDRTADVIEQSVGELARADPMQVAAMLARLGDPAVIAEAEYARLTAIRGEAELPAQRRRRVTGVRMRPEPGSASWHWPRAAGHPHLVNQILTSVPDPPAVPDAPAGNGVLGKPDPRPPAGPAIAAATAPATSPPASEATRPLAVPGPVAATRPEWPSTVTATSEPLVPGLAQTAGEAVEAEPEQEAEPGAAGEPGRAHVITAGLRRWIRAHPVEAVAVAFMGLGGAAYPPVWLLGAMVAFASKAWDYRDRWIGLAVPVLLLVVGTSLGVSLGGTRTSVSGYVNEGWLYADVLSRICAVLGTYYLVWRVEHPRQDPETPPWNRPHRVN